MSFLRVQNFWFSRILMMLFLDFSNFSIFLSFLGFLSLLSFLGFFLSLDFFSFWDFLGYWVSGISWVILRGVCSVSLSHWISWFSWTVGFMRFLELSLVHDATWVYWEFKMLGFSECLWFSECWRTFFLDFSDFSNFLGSLIAWVSFFLFPAFLQSPCLTEFPVLLGLNGVS